MFIEKNSKMGKVIKLKSQRTILNSVIQEV
jgi:hypothetical protein